MFIPQNIIDNIREANDIVSVISEYLPLKKSGVNYKCRCPFHNEKTASFIVSPSKQLYKCFGCGKGGNVFSFVMEYEKLNFPEAVEKLAERVHINIPKDKLSTERASNYKQIYDINEQAMEYFCSNLILHGDNALAYLKSRNLSSDTIKYFHLGLALDAWNGLMDYLKRKGHNEKTLLSAGLIKKSEQRLSDKFWKRIIFPIYSVNGKVIGFGGRIYTNDQQGPKYLNSPENVVFRKGRHVYALYQTKQYISQDKSAILVEGYMDAIKMFNFGFRNVVASLGTSLTENQAKLIARFTDNVYILYDGDSAGRTASIRASRIFLSTNIFPRIVILPKDEDPDSFLEKFGEQKLKDRIKSAKNFYEFILDIFGYGNDPNQDRKTVKEILESISYIQDDLQKEIYVREIAHILKLREESIWKSIHNLQYRVKDKDSKKEANNYKYSEEIDVIKFMLQNPDNYIIITDKIDDSYFFHPQCKKIMQLLLSRKDIPDIISNHSKLLDLFADKDRDFVAGILMSNTISKDNIESILEGLKFRKYNFDLVKISEKILKDPDNIEYLRVKERIKKEMEKLKGRKVIKLRG